MADLTLKQIEERIAITRENIRQATEQASGYSGAADEERNANLLKQQNDELDRLIKMRGILESHSKA